MGDNGNGELVLIENHALGMTDEEKMERMLSTVFPKILDDPPLTIYLYSVSKRKIVMTIQKICERLDNDNLSWTINPSENVVTIDNGSVIRFN